MSSSVILPNTLPECHAMLQLVLASVAELEQKVRLLNHKLFGDSSEQLKNITDTIIKKFEAFKEAGFIYQGELFNDLAGEFDKLMQSINPETEQKALTENAKANTSENKEPKTKKTNIKETAHLETKECHYDKDLSVCPNCQGNHLTELGCETTKQIDIVPAKFTITEHIVHKFVCADCKTMTRGEKPPSPLNKCVAGASLLADITYKRYGLYLPYYRLSRDFTSLGHDISEANLCNWMYHLSTDIMMPLYLALKKNVFSTGVAYCDETVSKERAKGKCIEKYIWAWSNITTKNVVFEYSNRGRENPTEFLKGFKNGFLVTDKYAGYIQACMLYSIIRCFCWLHSRRKFYDIIKSSTDPNELVFVKKIYNDITAMLRLDTQIRQGQRDQILLRRDKEVKPLIEAIFKTMETLRKDPAISYSKTIMAAIDYTLSSPNEFMAFLLHPDLQPTNNYSEQIIRFFTLLRKNSLFHITQRGGETTAILASIVASAKNHHLEVRAYLQYVIDNLPKAKESEIDAFLPQNCTQFQLSPKS